jgi:hypothetical protein
MSDEMQRPATTLDSTLVLFESRDLNSAPVCRLAKGENLQLGDATEFEGRQWFAARLPDGTSGFMLGPSVMGHTTAGPGIRARRRNDLLGEPDNIYAPRAEPRQTLLFLIVDASIWMAIVALLMRRNDDWIGGLLQLMLLFALPILGLIINGLLCAVDVRRESSAWPIALIGPVLWVLTIALFYFARGNRF